MALWGMVIDLDRCTGCQACVMACKAENNVPAVGVKEAKRGRIISWMQVLTETEEEHHETKMRFIPRPCLQCDDPPCTKVCPVYATYRDPEGIVGQIYPRCIGCRFCMAACPFGARSFNYRNPRPFIAETNKRFPTRSKGVVEKCNFCAERLAVGQLPACVEASDGKLVVGDLYDPESKVRELIRTNYTIRRKQALGTEPAVYYIV